MKKKLFKDMTPEEVREAHQNILKNIKWTTLPKKKLHELTDEEFENMHYAILGKVRDASSKIRLKG